MTQRLFKSREFLLLIAIGALVALIATRFPAFIAPGNLLNVYNDTAILIILALAQTAVILTKGIDLSIAANLALCGMVAAMINSAMPDVPVVALILVAIAVGTLLGAINGLLVWKVDIPPIVVTLGTMTIFRGVIFLLTDGAWINAHEMSDAFKAFARTDIGPLPVLSWMSIVVIVIMAVVLTRTAIGRAFYAVGGNPHASVYAGISVGRTQFIAYVLAGALAGLSGYLWVSRYAVAYVDIAGGFELDVVAACVIGGVSIAGGVGSVPGAVLGALFLGIIKNALPVIDISPFWQLAISGTVIIIAVAVNARSERRTGRVILKKAEHAT
ncbi:Ribose transport system permease protein RbsC [Hartmannibacter diazotrophicus]|uniref:Ribose transport system permease protein RbsC n=1 Tax=Hartmannibacter diazotrophicus TaxID=1482074 RepID=A0A2C9DAS9_9HYPH|nr:ABC transporter permease [Hartmannibacter diazotrophicus]SON57270.1 Ribose transport system permease protein RbsC [Hartmannibacter diazotrophicus]